MYNIDCHEFQSFEVHTENKIMVNSFFGENPISSCMIIAVNTVRVCI